MQNVTPHAAPECSLPEFRCCMTYRHRRCAIKLSGVGTGGSGGSMNRGQLELLGPPSRATEKF